MSKITGELRNTMFQTWPITRYVDLGGDPELAKEMRDNGLEEVRVYSGNCYGDIHGRFYEGQWIHTSYVISGPDEDGIIKTRNSTYKITS